MYTKDEEDLITLCSVGGLTAQQVRVLYSDYRNSQPDFQKHENFLIKSVGNGVYNKIRESLKSAEYRTRLLKSLEARNIFCVTRLSKDYPEQLKNVYNPPAVLFCKGDGSLLKNRLFAVVGSRKTLPNMLKECGKTVGELCRAFTVVTGLADGGDTAAAESALENGKVISVLAYGFDHVYPAVNAQLKRRIEEKGLLVSEYMPHIPPFKYYFLERNRIIAGLSEGVLVVSAAERSGALNTASHALEADRNVYAFPYSLGVASGEGCNKLIKEGAKLVTCAQDIFEDYGIELKAQETRKLSDDEQKIYAYLKERGEAYVHVMSEELGIPAFKMLPVLTRMEIDNLVARLGGNKYAAL